MWKDENAWKKREKTWKRREDRPKRAGIQELFEGRWWHESRHHRRLLDEMGLGAWGWIGDGDGPLSPSLFHVPLCYLPISITLLYSLLFPPSLCIRAMPTFFFPLWPCLVIYCYWNYFWPKMIFWEFLMKIGYF